MGSFSIWVIAIAIVVLVVTQCVKIVPQSQEWVIERLGVFYGVWDSGIHLKVPFLDRIVKKISMREQVVDFKPQDVITKDNVNMKVDTVVFYQVTDARLRTYGVEHPLMAIENLTATTLRNIIGDLELDESLTSRDLINTRITAILDEATDKWGIKINRVELKNITPPAEIQDAMEKQMKAERHKREQIIQAEGHRQSVETMAAGDANAQLVKAKANAEAKKVAAEAEAASIRIVNSAMEETLHNMKKAGIADEYAVIKALEAFSKAADGKATKIIIPSEIQGMAGLAASFKEVINQHGLNVEEDLTVEDNSFEKQSRVIMGKKVGIRKAKKEIAEVLNQQILHDCVDEEEELL